MTTRGEPALPLWTEADFDLLGWHDVPIHAVAMGPLTAEPGYVAFDLDYILATDWLPNRIATFAPATLRFDPAADLLIQASMLGHAFEPTILEIARQRPDDGSAWSSWTVIGDHFEARFRSPRFAQWLRAEPRRTSQNRLTPAERPPFALLPPGPS